MDLDKRRIRQIRGLIIFTVALIVLCFQIDRVIGVIKSAFGLIAPFLLGAAIAFVLNVLMRFIETKVFGYHRWKNNKIIRKIRRPASLLLSFLMVAGIVTVGMFVLLPELVDAGAKIASDIQAVIPVYQRRFQDFIDRYPKIRQHMEPILSAQPDWESLIKKFTDYLTVGGASLASSTVSTISQVIGKIFSGASTFFVGVVFSIYILVQKERLGNQVRRLITAFLPEKIVARIFDVGALCYRTFASFITGQCLEACILGMIFFVALTVGGFPYALPIAFIIGVFALIPIFGSFVGCFVGTFLILTESPLRALIFIALFLLIQQIEGNLIYPKVVGSSIGLPSIWVLVAVVTGGSLFGILGILIFIPLVSVIYALIQQEVRLRLKRKTKANASDTTNAEQGGEAASKSEAPPGGSEA